MIVVCQNRASSLLAFLTFFEVPIVLRSRSTGILLEPYPFSGSTVLLESAYLNLEMWWLILRCGGSYEDVVAQMEMCWLIH